MPSKPDAEVIREVTATIERALKKNRRTEWVVVFMLVALFVSGLSLILFGAVIQRWQLLVPGGILQLVIAFPIHVLIKLRGENMRLQIIPQLLRMA
jgi:cytochrome b subunit of formate dehydrogenase